MKPDFEKEWLTLTKLVQDAETKDNSMVAWMNEESFHKTLGNKGKRGFVSDLVLRTMAWGGLA